MAKTPSTDLTTVDTTALARPDFIKKSKEGTEHITRDDIQMPRLALAQSLTPQLDPSSPLYIESLKLGDMFNSVTGENYGAGPLEFFVLRGDPPRWVEFIPREQGGGIKDPNVPFNDPRTQWGAGGETPTATKFYDFIALLLPWNADDPMSRFIALSFKSSGIKVAKALNTLIQNRSAALYAGKYTIRSVDEKSAKGKFKNYQIKNAGWSESPEQLDILKQLADNLKDRQINVDRANADMPDSHEDDGTGDPTFMGDM